jgi:hypothetical protein
MHKEKRHLAYQQLCSLEVDRTGMLICPRAFDQDLQVWLLESSMDMSRDSITHRAIWSPTTPSCTTR